MFDRNCRSFILMRKEAVYHFCHADYGFALCESSMVTYISPDIKDARNHFVHCTLNVEGAKP
jgi:hypothetical protein